MFRCGLECLDDKYSVKQAEDCIADCGRPINLAMDIMRNELNTFQVRPLVHVQYMRMNPHVTCESV